MAATDDQASVRRKGTEFWNERDELQRLDFVAGVIAPTSLAGCVASAALIATGHLVGRANYVLGVAGLIMLGSAALATLSLHRSPLEAIQRGKDLDGVIAAKRLRTKAALGALVLSVFFGFGTTAVLEVIKSDDSHAQQKRSSHSKGSGSHQQERGSGAVWLHDQLADQDGNGHHRHHQARPVEVD